MAPGKHSRSESSHAEDPALKHPPAKRAKEIDADPPFDQLEELLEQDSVRAPALKPRNVLHWFRSKDVRQHDNLALHAASQKAREGGGSLITMYLHSPKDLEWHGASPVRIDLVLETLRMLKSELAEKNIPLAVVEAAERKEKVEKVMRFVADNDISHIYANMEYEVDELRRDIAVSEQVAENEGLAFELFHDQTVVKPGKLTTGAGGPIQVFTPYHKAWLAETEKDPGLIDTVSSPEENDKNAAEQFKDLFDSKVPNLPESKQFESKQDRDRLRKLWPPGHDTAMQRLKHFLNKKVSKYAAHRSEPAADVSSRLSPYIASGVISLRTILTETKKWNGNAHFDAGDVGVDSWVRELAFREFYRHMLVIKPHGSMNLPKNPKFDFVEWEEDDAGWKKWCDGTTGVPWVDAGMRQLRAEGWMHNRLRMQTASYLRANLLIDYRRGERFFAEHLVDWDLANNSNGWEPNYTIFNPISQAEKCDKEGKYIRKWVPELKDVEGKAIFAPFDRLGKEDFKKLGYPEPHVDYQQTAARANERYKTGLRSADL